MLRPSLSLPPKYVEDNSEPPLELNLETKISDPLAKLTPSPVGKKLFPPKKTLLYAD